MDRLLAKGGMSAVYLATHIQLNRQVALKILQPPTEVEDPEGFQRRFQLEAETLAGLHHPNIVVVHDYGETRDGRFFLAMEHIDGPRFTDLLRDGGLELDRIIKLVLQVCSGLRYAHKRGVIHRDIKPSNLLIRNIDGDEIVKVVDFGLVKLTEGEDQTITRAGMILGSPRYMAPEQVRGQDVDARTDIYAIGVLLYRSITGTYPFQGANSTATMLAHLHEDLPSFFTSNPDLEVPVGLEEVVAKCLAKSADDRYLDIASLIEELVTFVDMPADQFRSVSMSIPTSTGGAGTLARQTLPPEPRSSSMAMAIGGGVALLVLLGLGLALATALWMNRGEQPDPVPALALDEGPEEPAVAPEPIPEPEPAPEPEVAAEPAQQASAPAQRPPVRRPEPVAVRTPEPEPEPEEPASTEPAEEPENDAPEGYMELPEDF